MSIATDVDTGVTEKLTEVHVTPYNGGSPSSSMKTTKHGVILVPQPTDDPDEPLVRSFFTYARVYRL